MWFFINSYKRQDGISVIIAVFAMVIMAILGITYGEMITTSQRSRINNLQSHQALYLAEAGIEYALNKGTANSYGDGANITLGAGRFTISLSGNVVTATGYVGNSKKVLMVTVSGGEAGCLSVDTSSASLGGGNKNLQGITLQNTCTTGNITLDKIRVSWCSNDGELIESIEIQDTEVWEDDGPGSPSGKQPSGTTLDIVNLSLQNLTTYTVNEMEFDSSMTGKTITIAFIMGDGTTKTVTYGVSMANSLAINTSSVSYDNGGRDIKGITIQNTSATCNVEIDKITATWCPDNGEQLQSVSIGGNTYWSGSSGSGTASDITNYTLATSTTATIDYFRFNADMSSKNITLTFTMVDGTTKSAVIGSSQANNLSINTSGYNFTNGGKRLEGIVLSNTSTQCGINIDKITVSWCSNGGEKIETITLNSQNVWTGNSGSGNTLDITDFALSSSTTYNNNAFIFDSDMRNKNLVLTFIMQDGTSKSATIGASHADNLVVNTAGANISGGGNDKLKDISIQNTGSSCDVVIDKITVSWCSDSGEKITKIKINNDVWNENGSAGSPSGSQSSGSMLDIINYTLSPSSSVNIDEFKFNSDMRNKDFTIMFDLTDGSRKEAFAGFSSQNNTLVINSGGAGIGGTGNKELQGITMQNTNTSCAITVDKIQVSWCTDNSEAIQEIKIGTPVWTGTGSSGSNIDITNYKINPSSTIGIDRFLFNTAMTGKAFNLGFTMLDGTTKTANNILGSCGGSPLALSGSAQATGGSNNTIKFDITNTGANTTITDFKVVYNISPAYFKELKVEDVGLSGDKAWKEDGRYAGTNEQLTTINGNPNFTIFTLNGGSTTEFELKSFNSQQDGGGGNVNMSGATLTVTLYYAGGSYTIGPFNVN